jgi:hypothetical protein
VLTPEYPSAVLLKGGRPGPRDALTHRRHPYRRCVVPALAVLPLPLLLEVLPLCSQSSV